MIRFFIVIIFLVHIWLLTASYVDQSTADIIALRQLEIYSQPGQFTISSSQHLQNQGKVLGYVYYLKPLGYIVVSADYDLPPIIAYSTTSTFDDPANERNILKDIVSYDLNLRMQNLPNLPSQLIAQHHDAWDKLLDGHRSVRFDQWPPEGTTALGGWLKTQWTQSAPFNDLCPMDLQTGNRSLAGCPAIAMGQIVNYYATINGTQFSDTDDYHHNYAGNNYWIDNDFAAYGFPSFPQLNADLQTMMNHYRYQEEITNNDNAALVFACGVAAHQVFASAGSGTFSVNQALQAYQKFNFPTAQLMFDNNTNFYYDLAQNIINAKPIHLAIESPDLSSGHNVVIDGYNTDHFFHLNFGWGSAYDGWYLLPDDLPFGLTMIEGAILDIVPVQYISVLPNLLTFPAPILVNQPYRITIQNIYAESQISVEDCLFDTSFADVDWEIQHDNLPKTLAFGDTMSFSLIPHSQGSSSGNLYQTYFRIILDHAAVDVPIEYQSTVGNNEETQQAASPMIRLQQNYPNPFNPRTTICYELASQAPVVLSIYNVKGQLVKQLVHENQPAGQYQVNWDGINKDRLPATSGIYLYRLSTGIECITRKMILIK